MKLLFLKMVDKTVLVIDDNDQKNLLDRIANLARQNGINMIYKQLNVGSPNEPDLLTDGNIDVSKVKAVYKDRFKNKGIVFNMILCDWNLSDEFIDGAELIRRMGNECFKEDTPKILYSSLLREKLEEQLNKYDKDNNDAKESVIKYIISLINGNYKAFVARENLQSAVLGHLMDSENIDFLLADALNRYPDQVMAVGHGHNLDGRSFAEVARMIENDEKISYDFKRDIIQEVVQYLTHQQSIIKA